jgi:hypothetical protein
MGMLEAEAVVAEPAESASGSGEEFSPAVAPVSGGESGLSE